MIRAGLVQSWETRCAKLLPGSRGPRQLDGKRPSCGSGRPRRFRVDRRHSGRSSPPTMLSTDSAWLTGAL